MTNTIIYNTFHCFVVMLNVGGRDNLIVVKLWNDVFSVNNATMLYNNAMSLWSEINEVFSDS